MKEVIVNKGMSYKKLRIMGRGRQGVGYKRYSHVRIILEKIDFEREIAAQETSNQKAKWLKRKNEVLSIKAGMAATITTGVSTP